MSSPRTPLGQANDPAAPSGGSREGEQGRGNDAAAAFELGAAAEPARRPGWLARSMLALIRLYQQGVSPGLGTMCRFEPSCSRYAYEAIEVHGAGRGSWLAARRLGRCHPGTPGGYDPVPPVT